MDILLAIAVKEKIIFNDSPGKPKLTNNKQSLNLQEHRKQKEKHPRKSVNAFTNTNFSY